MLGLRIIKVFFGALLVILTALELPTPSGAVAQEGVSLANHLYPRTLRSRSAKTNATLDYVREQIKELGKEIRALNRKLKAALAAGKLKLALQIQGEIAGRELKQNRLKERLRQGDCPGNKILVVVPIENNSDYDVEVRLLTSQNPAYLLKVVPPRSRSSVVLSFLTLNEADFFKLMVAAQVNLKWSYNVKDFKVRRQPTERPCKLSFRTWELFNKTFPVVYEYQVFNVESCGALFIGRSEELANRTMSSFTGCSWSTDKVSYIALTSPFTTLEGAQQAFCSLVKSKGWWNGGACERVYCTVSSGCTIQLGSPKAYWGCESSLQAAAKAYCPQLAY